LVIFGHVCQFASLGPGALFGHAASQLGPVFDLHRRAVVVGPGNGPLESICPSSAWPAQFGHFRGWFEFQVLSLTRLISWSNYSLLFKRWTTPAALPGPSTAQKSENLDPGRGDGPGRHGNRATDPGHHQADQCPVHSHHRCPSHQHDSGVQQVMIIFLIEEHQIGRHNFCRILILGDGKVLEFGEPDNLLKDEQSLFHKMAKQSKLL